MIENLDAFAIVVIIVSLIISITIHEMMHAYTSLKLGDTTAHEHGRISLNPLKHVDPFSTILLPIITLVLFQVPLLAAKPVPFNPDRVKWDEFGAALVAIAGPLTNLALAVFGAVAARYFSPDPTLITVWIIFASVNVGLFIFNMIPIPPLDGSRVLYAFAPESLQRFMSQLEYIGVFLIFGLIIMVPAFGQFIIELNRTILNLLF